MKRVLFWGLVVPALLRRIVPAWLLDSPTAVAARHPWLALAAIGGALLLGAGAVAASGFIPMRASTGHWPITERLLHFSMRRSVVTNAMSIAAPPLDDPALVARAAGHYELGCRPCHGGTADDVPQIPRRMQPPPRPLHRHARDWRPRELFYIVKHGMKFTGMPAWPAQQRDDEVWAMVAFLGRLPTLDVGEYRRLTGIENTGAPFELGPETIAPAPRVVAELCARCHGLDGAGRDGGAAPRLAGQRADYLDRALRAYADGRRFSGIMSPIAVGLDVSARNAAVQHYASLPPDSPPGPGEDPAVARGRTLATEGDPARLIPPCAECHGPAATPRNPAYPRLAGQYPDYLALQLRLLREQRRGGSEFVHLMHSFASRLTDQQIRDAALYFASLGDTAPEGAIAVSHSLPGVPGP